MNIARWRLFREFVRTVRKTQVQTLAASMAYSTVLSVAPFVAIILAMAQVFGYLAPTLARFEPDILRFFAAGTGESIVAELQESVRKIREGSLGGLGLLSLIFVSMKLLSEVNSAFQSIWQAPNQRPWWRQLGLHAALLITGPAFLAILFAVNSSTYIELLPTAAHLPVSGLGIFGVLYLLFKLLPNCKVNRTAAALGSLFSSLALLLLQAVYGWATRNLMNYDKIYGSLSSVFLFLVWVLIVWNIILLGVALSATWQRLRERP